MRLRNTWVGLLGIALATTLACGGGQETSSTAAKPESPSAAAAGQKVDTATAGDVKGVAMLDGAAPKNEPIKMNADPVCVKQNTTPQFAGDLRWSAPTARSLGNVFVYVKDGLGNYVFDTPTKPAKIDQKNCRYHPHVFGIMRQSAAGNREQRSDAAQHPRDAEGQLRVQQRPADSGHEDDPHLRQARGDGALQVRRARLDERLRRRA